MVMVGVSPALARATEIAGCLSFPVWAALVGLGSEKTGSFLTGITAVPEMAVPLVSLPLTVTVSVSPATRAAGMVTV